MIKYDMLSWIKLKWGQLIRHNCNVTDIFELGFNIDFSLKIILRMQLTCLTYLRQLHFISHTCSTVNQVEFILSATASAIMRQIYMPLHYDQNNTPVYC